MLWRCPACNCQTQEEVCSRCQTPMKDGEPSAATGLLKETFGSVPYLIAVIAFTAALIFSMAAAFFPADPVSLEDVKKVVVTFSDVTGTKMEPAAWGAIHTLYSTIKEEAGATDTSLPLMEVLACVGLWLLLGQGYTARVNLRKGGPIVLKIAVIFGEVAAWIATVCGVLLAVGLWAERAQLVEILGTSDDALLAAFHDLLSCEATMWLLLLLCAVMAVCGLVYVVFFLSAARTVNSMLFTAKTGDFGKRAGLFVGIALCVAGVAMTADAVLSLMMRDWRGIGSLLYGVAYLLFAILLFCYRHRAHTLLWEQPAFTGVGTPDVPHIPVNLKASDLMREQTVTPMAVAPTQTGESSPRRTLNEPFREESLEPKPMTKNGCCPKCGTPIPDNAFFCLNCGYKLG